MKKVFAAAFAAAIMMLSALPAFAAVDSPVATTKPDTTSSTKGGGGGGGGGTVVVKDCGVISPKTGSSDITAASIIALSAASCGAVSVLLLRSKSKK